MTDEISDPTKEPAASSSGFFRKLWIGLAVGLCLWVAGATLVLWWQPNRFVQLAIIAAAVIGAFSIPKRHIDRVLACFAGLILIVALFYAPSWLLSTEVEFTVRGSDRDLERNLYLIHTDYRAKSADDPGETFRNQDAPLFWKFNSSDYDGVFESLTGQRVRARVIGVRFADVSMYRNVVSVESAE